jgi:hypothetical protein
MVMATIKNSRSSLLSLELAGLDMLRSKHIAHADLEQGLRGELIAGEVLINRNFHVRITFTG